MRIPLKQYHLHYIVFRNKMASKVTSFLQHVAGSVVPSSIGQVCLALAIISPLLAYPFLPHHRRTRDYNPASSLETISKGQLFFHFIITIYSACDVNIWTAAPIPVNTWPLYISVFTLAASHPAISFSEENRLQPSDFDRAGHWVCCSLLYFLYQTFDIILGRNSYAFVLAALVVYYISERLMKYVTKYTHAYITRDISSLGWRFWPIRGSDDFEPGWSVILFLALLLGQGILILLALADALRHR